jgi:nucleoside-diphosphate-sugar epimerase
MKTKRALLTGGAGFIGSNLAIELTKRGVDVDIVDDMSNGQLEFLPLKLRSKLLIDDFASDRVLEKIKTGTYDVIFHIAAVPRVSYSVEHPVETNNTNVTKTLTLINACRDNVKRFVFASSSSVYGNTESLPTKTTNQKNPQSPYALQKSIIEDYLSLYSRLYGLDSVCLRFFNVFGPNQLGGSPYSTAVGAWLTAIKSGRSMRSDGDGSQSRDMCYVDNVVDACIRGAEADGQLKAESLNIACGDRTTNKEILEYLLSKYPDAKYHDAPWRPGDVMHTLADVSRTTEVLGYTPLVRFWEGLDRTIKWYDENWDMIKKLSLKA